MATISNSVQGKWEEEEDEEQEEEEEEALSLCDLPVTLINDKDQDQSKREDSHFNETSDEEFDFRSWGGLFFEEPEMCAADDVFFQGQILPLRQSFSSEVPLIAKHDGKELNRSKSMSESLDCVSQSESHSNSSRSSSVRSQNSSSSSSSPNTTTNTTIPRVSKPKIRNQFHTHPSPRPQLRSSGPRISVLSNQGRKSSAWEFFRLGVVPTPEIGLQDLKVRSSSTNKSVSRNSSSNSSSNSNRTSNANSKSINMSNKTHHHSDKSNHHGFKQFVGKGGGLFMSSCKCSVDTVRSDIVMIKGGTKANKTESTTHAEKEKVVELNMKQQKKKQRPKKQGKKVMSRRRTFEWLKELHANSSHTDEEALLSNS